MSSNTAERPVTGERDLLTLEGVIERTGWGRTATYQRAREDDLPFPVLRVGRKLYVSRRAYERWLNGESRRQAG